MVWCGMVCELVVRVSVFRFARSISMSCFNAMRAHDTDEHWTFLSIYQSMASNGLSLHFYWNTFNLNSIQIVRWSIQFTFEEKSNIFIKWIAPNSNATFTCEIKLAVFLFIFKQTHSIDSRGAQNEMNYKEIRNEKNWLAFNLNGMQNTFEIDSWPKGI